jgi:hypothetical protein
MMVGNVEVGSVHVAGTSAELVHVHVMESDVGSCKDATEGNRILGWVGLNGKV